MKIALLILFAPAIFFVATAGIVFCVSMAKAFLFIATFVCLNPWAHILKWAIGQNKVSSAVEQLNWWLE